MAMLLGAIVSALCIVFLASSWATAIVGLVLLT